MKSFFEKIKANKLLLFGIFPFLLIAICFSFIYKSPTYFIRADNPQTSQTINTFSYTDKVHNGNSTIQILTNTSNKFSYRYQYKDGHKYTFAIAGYCAEKGKFFDLSDYNYMKVKLRAKVGKKIGVDILTFVDNYTSDEKPLSHKPLQYVLNVGDESKEIKFSFQDLYTPDWWYSENNKKEADFSKPKFDKIQSITFSGCFSLGKNIDDLVEIEEIYFGIDLFSFYISSSVFLILYFVTGWVVLYRKKLANKTKLVFHNNKIENSIYSNKEEETVFGYLSKHYYKQDLSLADIQQDTNLSERIISNTIKNKSGLNFKQFLNNLRIAEAKRLLISSDLQVSEIAFKVGYVNASHFNRVFKEIENCSPNDFRKLNQKSTKSKSDHIYS